MSTREVERFDAVVIGAGQGGNPLAREMAGSGWKTALIERAEVGGTCINRGCTPTKTMAASARVAYLSRRAADFGVDAGSIEVDMVRVGRRTWGLVAEWRESGERRIGSTAGLKLIKGDARFSGPLTLEVLGTDGRRTLTAPVIVIDTGTRPADPGVPGLREAGALDSTSVMRLDAVPEHLVIIGGGPVGVEFGQMFRRFGSAVTIVQRDPRLLPAEDADVSLALTRVLEEDGVDVLLSTRVLAAAPGPAGGVELSVEASDRRRTLAASHVLAAAGRVPNTERLGLDVAGVAVDERGYVVVNHRLETSAPGVYAIGDVTGGPAFTHISYDDFRVLRALLLGGPGSVTTVEAGAPTSTTDRLVPYTVFTDPQLGRVGLTERQAREAGHDVRVARLTMDRVARALETDEPRGLLKAVVDRRTDRILGFAALAVDGGELMAMIEIAMLGGVTASVLREAVFAHPTLAESLNSLFAAFED